MNSDAMVDATERDLARALPFVLVLFCFSGGAALIYEIVWYQLLQIAIGSTAFSLGVLLASFMGGLCLGSLALPALSGRFTVLRRHPLKIFAAIETLIAVCGAAELLLIPLAGDLSLQGPQAGFAGMILRSLVSAACLLPPTCLMGASLPALAAWVGSGSRGALNCGLLYAANTIGAVAGCLVAGFYLLRLFDVDIASCVAIALNLAVATLSLAFAHRLRAKVAQNPEASGPARKRVVESWPICAAMALSGMAALGSEVVWTRAMGLVLGATVYAFSIILAVFLAGLALGTAAASALSRNINPRLALGWCQILAAAGIAWTAYALADSLPWWPINPQLARDPKIIFQLDLVRTIWGILPATLFWGASFPFAFAAAFRGGADRSAVTGAIYGSNTAGAIAGGLAVSLAAIPLLGTQNTERVLMFICAASGLFLLFPLMRSDRVTRLELAAGVATGLIALFIWQVDRLPGELIAFGRRTASTAGMARILYSAEGQNTAIAISQWNDGALQFHVAGKVEASTEAYDMRLQRMLAHVPGLMHDNPRSVLVVGFGGGITAGTFTTYPSVKRIVICELEPLIPPVSTRYFAKENYNVLHDARTQMVYDDARHFIAATRERFDIITSDPIHPFVKGSAALYSKEYFELVKAHLNPGGVVTQWVPLYESDADTVRSEIATFFEVFPFGTVWANNANGQGYDLVLAGQLTPPSLDIGNMEARLASRDYRLVAQSLHDVNLESASDLFASYTGDRKMLEPWLKDAAINHDRDLRLQYLAGLALNHAEEDTIYRDMLIYWTRPISLFRGSPSQLSALYAAMEAGMEGGPGRRALGSARKPLTLTPSVD
jgi:spermidine synthase